jgi:hypothetical protein
MDLSRKEIPPVAVETKGVPRITIVNHPQPPEPGLMHSHSRVVVVLAIATPGPKAALLRRVENVPITATVTTMAMARGLVVEERSVRARRRETPLPPVVRLPERSPRPRTSGLFRQRMV